MQITVFGASGGIGRHVVDQALDAGHDVVAHVRDAAKLDGDHPDLRVVVGELTDRPQILEAIGGSDAVISALGPSLERGATGTPVADGTRAVIDVMQAKGVKRYVGLATPSIADPRDRPSLTGRLLPLMARLFLPNALKELHGMTEAVTESGRDWTVKRPG